VTWRTRTTIDCSSMVDVGVGTDEDEGGMYIQLMMKDMNQCYPCSSSDQQDINHPMNEEDVNCEPRMSMDTMDRQMMIMAQRIDTSTNDASSFSAIDNSIMPSHWPSFHRLQQSASQDRSIMTSINLSTTQSIDLLNDISSIDVHKQFVVRRDSLQANAIHSFSQQAQAPASQSSVASSSCLTSLLKDVSSIDVYKQLKNRRRASTTCYEEEKGDSNVVQVQPGSSTMPADPSSQYVDTIIDLKLQIANQKSVIDTLSSKLNQVCLEKDRVIKDLVSVVKSNERREVELSKEMVENYKKKDKRSGTTRAPFTLCSSTKSNYSIPTGYSANLGSLMEETLPSNTSIQSILSMNSRLNSENGELKREVERLKQLLEVSRRSSSGQKGSVFCRLQYTTRSLFRHFSLTS